MDYDKRTEGDCGSANTARNFLQGAGEESTARGDTEGHGVCERVDRRLDSAARRERDSALAEFKLPQKVIDKIVADYKNSKPVDEERSMRAVKAALDKNKHREYDYRPAYDDFGFSPVKSNRGKLSKAKRAEIQAMLDEEKEKGLKPSASSVEDWWEKKKLRTKEERNRRRRLQRAAAKKR